MIIPFLPLITKFLPMKWPIIIAASLALVIGVFVYGASFGKAKEIARGVEAVEAAHEAEQQIQFEQREALEAFYNELLARNVTHEIIERQVLRYVETPAASESCFDADGLQLVTEILND